MPRMYRIVLDMSRQISETLPMKIGAYEMDYFDWIASAAAIVAVMIMLACACLSFLAQQLGIQQ